MKDDDYQGCGISRLWATSEKDPFIEACQAHDAFYKKDSAAQKIMTRKEADRIFLSKMLSVATNPLLKAKAYLYYAIVRAVGGLYWEGKR